MKKVIVDADGLIALFSSDDAHAEHALHLLQRLTAQEAQLLHPTTAIVEAITTLQRKLHRPELAAQIAETVQEGQLPLVPVTEATLFAAFPYFKPTTTSKGDTLFDAIVAAIAKETQADAIFSFDSWYTRQGFTLIADLEKTT